MPRPKPPEDPKQPTPPRDGCATPDPTALLPPEEEAPDLSARRPGESRAKAAARILRDTLKGGAGLLLVAALLPGCPEEEPADPTPAPFDPAAHRLLSLDLTEADGEAEKGNGEENVFHVSRFHTDTPARIVALEVQFRVRADDDKPAHLAVFPDEGHNFYDFLREAPYVQWDLELNKDEHDRRWMLIELDEPVVLDRPGLFYVGSHYRGEAGQPVLAADDAATPDPFLLGKMSDDELASYKTTVYVLPDRGVNEQGFEAYGFQDRDLLIRVYLDPFDEPASPTWFREAQYVDEANPGIGLPGSGSPSFGDCDGDGDEDFYSGALWRNDEGTFVQLSAEESGIDVGGGGTWGDYDNDGDLDLFVFRADDQLYEAQGDCTFVNVTAASGIDDTQPFASGEGTGPQHVPTPSAAWVDVNHDGLLDLMQANFMDFGTGDSADDLLWINQGDGLFVNATEELGLDQRDGFLSGLAGRGVALSDWDLDGDPDIYISNYRLHPNYAWRNDGAGESFVNVGYKNAMRGVSVGGYYGHTIGSAFGDLDGDGDTDLFAANLAHPRFIDFSDKSMLLSNQLLETGRSDFVEMRDEAALPYQETDSSPVLFDYDNDGDLDLFYTAVYPARPSWLFRNDGDWRFTFVTHHAGTWIYNGWGVASADLDNDGDLDLVGGKVLINEHPDPGGWLQVRVVGSGQGGTNRSGIGAKVRVTTAEGTMLREVFPATGVGSQNSLIQHVGLGDAASANVEVEFPATGTVVDAGSVDSGTRLVVHEDGTVTTR